MINFDRIATLIVKQMEFVKWQTMLSLSLLISNVNISSHSLFLINPSGSRLSICLIIIYEY